MRRFTDGVLTRMNSCRFVFIRGFHCIVTAERRFGATAAGRGQGVGSSAQPARFRAKISGLLWLDFLFHWNHDAAMKLILSTHNVTLTKAIEDHILSRIDKLDHFD